MTFSVSATKSKMRITGVLTCHEVETLQQNKTACNVLKGSVAWLSFVLFQPQTKVLRYRGTPCLLAGTGLKSLTQLTHWVESVITFFNDAHYFHTRNPQRSILVHALPEFNLHRHLKLFSKDCHRQTCLWSLQTCCTQQLAGNDIVCITRMFWPRYQLEVGAHSYQLEMGAHSLNCVADTEHENTECKNHRIYFMG